MSESRALVIINLSQPTKSGKNLIIFAKLGIILIMINIIATWVIWAVMQSRNWQLNKYIMPFNVYSLLNSYIPFLDGIYLTEKSILIFK